MAAAASPAGTRPPDALPELAGVPWRSRADERSLTRRGRLWTATTLAHVLPFLATALLLALLDPILIPASLIAITFAWAIPELYAARGAGVLRAHRSRSSVRGAPQRRALGLLADLVGHEARTVLLDTGYVIERGALGIWVLGEAGTVLVRPGGRRVQCMCVRVAEPELPPADRIAHLLLALRADEAGFATLANLAFAGAPWRLLRRLPEPARRAVSTARAAERS
jgi:hypothetical protein